MDIQQQNWPYLEAIQEESEQEDETDGSTTGEGEEDFQIQEGVETKGVQVEEESDEEDDGSLLKVLRCGRQLPSLSQRSSLKMQSTFSDQKEMKNFTVSDSTKLRADLSDEATSPAPPRLGKQKCSSSGAVRVKIRLQKHKPLKQSVQKTTKRTKKNTEHFPQWLVSLMVNIEEATTHQLVVE